MLTSASFTALLLTAFLVALLARRFKLDYAPALALTGLGIGALHLAHTPQFSPTLLLTVLLPPLLFEGALHLPAHSLKKEFRGIALLALAGTLAAAFAAGALLAWLMHMPMRSALVFGAIMAATDPVSVIALFHRMGAPERLTLLLEAESLFNDGVAAAFTLTLLQALGSRHPLLYGCTLFLQTAAGGALTGCLLGWAAAHLHSKLDDTQMDLMLTTLLAYGSYFIADLLHCSGVVSVVAAGVVAGNLGLVRELEETERKTVLAFWQYAAFVANSLVFLLVGIESARPVWVGGAAAALCAIAATLAGRAVVYPLCALAGQMGEKIPVRWQHLLWWGGLRGALGMALALGLPASFPYRGFIISAAFSVVLFSLLVQGFTVGPLMRYLERKQQAAPLQ